MLWRREVEDEWTPTALNVSFEANASVTGAVDYAGLGLEVTLASLYGQFSLGACNNSLPPQTFRDGREEFACAAFMGVEVSYARAAGPEPREERLVLRGSLHALLRALPLTLYRPRVSSRLLPLPFLFFFAGRLLLRGGGGMVERVR